MISASIETRVKDIIAQQLSRSSDDISREKTLADLGADSLDVVELIMAMEVEFQLDIPDQDAESIMTVGDVIEYITKHEI